jgi:hypothetical protein
MATGDQALAGEEERDIPGHRFPPEASKDRTIYFRGLYLSIVNKDTNDVKTQVENTTATTQYKAYEIPAGYTCYIRGASVYFKT